MLNCDGTEIYSNTNENRTHVPGEDDSDCTAPVTCTVAGAYTALNDAIQAVANCTAEDKAVVTILQDIDLGESYQYITSGEYGKITGSQIAMYLANGCNVTISGGSFTGEKADIYSDNSAVTLTLDENGMGATFPGAISVMGTTLNEILNPGAAYWQGEKVITPADEATKITGGDVTVKAVCTHPAEPVCTHIDYKTHTASYPCCGTNTEYASSQSLSIT